MNVEKAYLMVFFVFLAGTVLAQEQEADPTSATDVNVRIEKNRKTFRLNHHARTGREIQGENVVYNGNARSVHTGREVQGENPVFMSSARGYRTGREGHGEQHVYKRHKAHKGKKFKGHSSTDQARVFHNHFKGSSHHKSGYRKVLPKN
jgi:hypothetical protein